MLNEYITSTFVMKKSFTNNKISVKWYGEIIYWGLYSVFFRNISNSRIGFITANLKKNILGCTKHICNIEFLQV